MVTCQICWTAHDPSVAECPVCRVSRDRTPATLSPEEKKTSTFARALRVLGVLEQIGAVSIGLLVVALVLPAFFNPDPALSGRVWKSAAILIGAGGGAAVFLFYVGKMLRRYQKIAWTATLVMVAMSIALNGVKLNLPGLLIPAIYLFFLLHPQSRIIVNRRQTAERQNLVA